MPQPHALLRAIDASLNRAAEGARVVEDYARFVLDDPYLTAECKQLRHDLAEVDSAFPTRERLVARDTEQDVGTGITTPQEGSRTGGWEVGLANLHRLQEALRSLEEFSKVVDPKMAARFEALRYRAYTLGKALGNLAHVSERLRGARLYLLLPACDDLRQFEQLAREVCTAGADLVQLRAKGLEDRELVERARALARIAREKGALSIINDRPDMARLADADGVHVGQDDLSVQEAREIVGPEKLVGLSTHSREQLKRGILAGADYIGLGPTFPSTTKSFDQFAGLEYLREAAATTQLPTFAIGGISQKNLPEVLATGVTRVAIGSAVVQHEDPKAAVQQILDLFG